MWSNPPDFDDVRDTFKEYGSVTAEITALEEYIEQSAITIKKESPRKPWLIRERFATEYQRLATLYTQRKVLEQELAFLTDWKDIYRSYGYNNK